MNCKKIFGLALSMLFCAETLGADGALAAQHQLHMPTKLPTPQARKPMYYTPDILLVMPNPKAGTDDLTQALQDVHGTVIGSMGEGRLKCLIVRTEKGKLVDTENKMKKDKKDFFCIGRDYQVQAEMVPDDPSYTSQWHLGAIDCAPAWDATTGSGATMAILDSGCQASNPDIADKTQKGFDATSFWAHIMGTAGVPTAVAGVAAGISTGIAEATNSGAQQDVQGHGTWVATCAGATANNNLDGVGVAPSVSIYPIKVATSSGSTDPIAIQAAILQCMIKGIKIINLSYGAAPPWGFTDPAIYPTLHAYFAFYHDIFGGCIFISAGNNGDFDGDPQLSYYNVVSAIDPTMTLAKFSNYGNSITFTAPGSGIVVSSRDNSQASVAGTSFSSPIVASIAALVWSVNPGLSNTQVERILKLSCWKTSDGGSWNQYYGYGMPDANQAVSIAKSGNF